MPLLPGSLGAAEHHALVYHQLVGDGAASAALHRAAGGVDPAGEFAAEVAGVVAAGDPGSPPDHRTIAIAAGRDTG